MLLPLTTLTTWSVKYGESKTILIVLSSVVANDFVTSLLIPIGDVVPSPQCTVNDEYDVDDPYPSITKYSDDSLMIFPVYSLVNLWTPVTFIVPSEFVSLAWIILTNWYVVVL